MSNIYSFQNDRLKRDDVDNLYNLNAKTVVYDSKSLPLYEHIVSRDQDMRLDLVCDFLYGNKNYIEELMQINNLFSFFTISEGDVVYYFKNEDREKLYSQDKEENDNLKNSINPNKNTQKDKNREKLSPNLKPNGLEQLQINKNNSKIKIINKFE